MFKLLIMVLTLSCAVNLDISSKHSEEWCLKECDKYNYPNLIIAPLLIAGYESPECICMTECMNLDSTYCVKSNQP